ncbi:MAG TPA: hypothetical protein DCM05_17480 [Elusimicrobia bacterium]|nr:hypothetical protein [Elusimicrobiota bacterium]
MNRYLSLARRAWRSGEYRAKDAADADALQEDAEALRRLIRSKMEWIVERESGLQAGPGALRLSSHVRFRPETRGAFLLDTRSEKVFRLSAAGAAVAGELASGVRSEGEVVSRLKARFRDPDGALERQVRAFLDDLRAQGFLDG